MDSVWVQCKRQLWERYPRFRTLGVGAAPKPGTVFLYFKRYIMSE